MLARLAVLLPAWVDADATRLDATRDEAPHTASIALLACAGACLVSFAYGWGRLMGGITPVATAVFWIGQAVLLLPIAWRLLARGARTAERLALLVVLAALQSLLAWAYSPLGFRFPDELQHVRTATDILRTGHLFTPNPALPVSSGFPGLEIATVGLMRVTGLPLFAAGKIVVSLAHAALIVVVYLLVATLVRSPRVAGAGALVYALSPHFSYFNTLFVYGAFALPFLVVTVLVGLRVLLRGTSPWWLAPPFAVVMVSHHLTALATVGLLALISAIGAVDPTTRPRAKRLGIGTAVAAVLLVAWVAVAAPETFSYLGQPVVSLAGGLLASVGRLFGHGASGTATGVRTPLPELLVSAAAALVLALLVCLGLLIARRAQLRETVLLIAACGLLYIPTVGLRVLVPSATEVSGRALTYVMLLSALPAALALLGLAGSPRVRRQRAGGLSLLAVTVAAAGAITAGLPPWWERIPGRFSIGSFEAGVDSHTVAMTDWAQQEFGTDDLLAADLGSASLLGGYARANASTSVAALYDTATLPPALARIRSLGIDWLVIDRRMTTQRPLLGVLFPGETRPGVRTGTVPSSHLRKFVAAPRLDRMYDDGTLLVYRTTGVWSR